MRLMLRAHVRGDHIVPHAERDEDVRGHVLRVRGVWRDPAVRARGIEAERGVRGIVDGMDQVVRATRMIRMRREKRCARSRTRADTSARRDRPD